MISIFSILYINIIKKTGEAGNREIKDESKIKEYKGIGFRELKSLMLEGVLNE